MTVILRISTFYSFLAILLCVNDFAVNGEQDNCDTASGVCYKRDKSLNNKRYLLYDVNYGEGFNLKRDVYMRVANLVKNLRNDDDKWVLVLPPWGYIYHWFNRYLNQNRLPWSQFFDLNSLNMHVPVIEFEKFLEETNDKNEIDQIFYLQNYKDGFTSGNWEEKYKIDDCNEQPVYKKEANNKYYGHFWGYRDKVFASNFTCVSYQGMSKLMIDLLKKYPNLRSVFIDRAEVLLHDNYGQVEYWNCRRSMKFAKRLIEAGNNIRETMLDSNDVNDKTVLDDDWRRMVRKHGDAFGGPYLAVHLRRGDFVESRKSNIPTLKYAAKQIRKLLKTLNLNVTYLATDATDDEVNEIKRYLKAYIVVRYVPSDAELEQFKDGGVAIIDQWICSHARYFIGSYESTFSFRIQEEREILGFDPKTTFNRLCNENEKCEQPSKWLIVYK